MLSSASTSPRATPARPIWRAGLIGGVLAIIANSLVYLLLQALRVPLEIPMGGPGGPITALPLSAVILFTAIPAIAATLLYWLLARFTARPAPIFLTIAIIFLLVSFIPDFTLPVPLATQLSLAAMHVVAALFIAGGLLRLTR